MTTPAPDCRCGLPMKTVEVKPGVTKFECEHCDHLCKVVPQSACERCSALMANRR